MKFGYGILLMTAPLLIAGCVSTSATQLSRNQVMISTSAAPVCGVTGAQQVASKMAAVETLRRGYERFIIQGMQAQNNVRTTQRAPTGSFTTGTFNTYGNTTYGMANTSYTGGGVMISGSNDASLVVTMMNRGEPGFQNGVDAKGVLGPDWENLVENGIKTCG